MRLRVKRPYRNATMAFDPGEINVDEPIGLWLMRDCPDNFVLLTEDDKPPLDKAVKAREVVRK